MKPNKKNPAAVALGSMKSERKARASRENGKKGGRPRKHTQADEDKATQRMVTKLAQRSKGERLTKKFLD